MRGRFHNATLLILLTAALAPGLAGCDRPKAENNADAARPVLTTTVHYAAHSQERDFVASIRPRVETDHHAPVAVPVAARMGHVDTGKSGHGSAGTEALALGRKAQVGFIRTW